MTFCGTGREVIMKAKSVPYIRFTLKPEHAALDSETLAKLLELTFKPAEAPGSQYAYFYCSSEEALCAACGRQFVATRENCGDVLEVLPGTPENVQKRIERFCAPKN